MVAMQASPVPFSARSSFQAPIGPDVGPIKTGHQPLPFSSRAAIQTSASRYACSRAAPSRSVEPYMFSAPRRSARPVTRNCSASCSFRETTTSFEPTAARLSAYRRSTSMNVEPMSLRSRRRRMTTAFRDWVCRCRQGGGEDRGGGEEQAAVGLENDDLAGGKTLGRVDFYDVSVVGEQPLFDGDLVRLPDDVEGH